MAIAQKIQEKNRRHERIRIQPRRSNKNDKESACNIQFQHRKYKTKNEIKEKNTYLYKIMFKKGYIEKLDWLNQKFYEIKELLEG